MFEWGVTDTSQNWDHAHKRTLGFKLNMIQKVIIVSSNIPPHDKINKMTVRPAKTQISLGIRPVWSESSLCAKWVAEDPSFLHVDSEEWSDQADLSLRWAHSHFVGFAMRWLKFYFDTSEMTKNT